MISVITGDVVASQKMPEKEKWVDRLKAVMHEFESPGGRGKKPVVYNQSKIRWEIYRGDGFQIEMEESEKAFHLVMAIRSGLKSLPEFYEHGLDVRMAIGVGEQGFIGSRVGESDGEAYRYSGPLLDSLKNEHSKLKLKSPYEEFNTEMNVSLAMASAIMDDWSQASAEIVWLKSNDEEIIQEQMAKNLGISQPAVHKRLLNAHYRELQVFNRYFMSRISSLDR